MAEQYPEIVIGKLISPVSTVLGALLIWLTAGSTGVARSALVPLLSILGGIGGLVFSLIYRRYVGVLGAGAKWAKWKGSPERQSYDALRNSLVEGGSAARLYARRLTNFLDAIDRFFGDAGMASRTLFPRAFGVKTPAPLGTAPAFDQCLLLALIYPVATIFIVWTVSGHVGPAKAALHLTPDLPGWRRGIVASGIGFTSFAVWWYFLPGWWKGGRGFVSATVASAVAAAFGAGAGGGAAARIT